MDTMTQRLPDKRPWLALVTLAAMLGWGALLSATALSAEIVLRIHGKFDLSRTDVHATAIMVAVVLLAEFCGKSMPTRKRSYQASSILFSIMVGGMGGFVILNPGGVLGEYRLSAWSVMVLASVLIMWSGAKLGAYYGWYGAPHKMLHRKAVLIPLIAAGAFVYVIIRDAIGGQPEEYQFILHLVAVGAVAFKVMLAAKFGAEYATNKVPSKRRGLREVVYWLLLVGPVFPIAILYSSRDLCMDDPVMLQYAISALTAVMIVAGAVLGAHLSSLKPLHAAKFWFGYAVLGLVYALSIVDVKAHLLLEGPCPDMTLSVVLALISSTMGALSALLGAHYSVRLRKRLGAD